jgi:hypothetical protein
MKRERTQILCYLVSAKSITLEPNNRHHKSTNQRSRNNYKMGMRGGSVRATVNQCTFTFLSETSKWLNFTEKFVKFGLDAGTLREKHPNNV